MGVTRRPRGTSWPPTRLLAAFVLAAGLVAACGKPSSAPAGVRSTAAASTTAQQMLAFARCLRNHRVPNWPDPNASGTFPRSAKQIAANNSRFPAAQTACRHLLPSDGNRPSPAQWRQIRSTMVAFARCMRKNGMPNWPYPTNDAHGRPVFRIRIDPGSPQFTTKIHACEHLLHNYGSKPGWPDLGNYFRYTPN